MEFCSYLLFNLDSARLVRSRIIVFSSRLYVRELQFIDLYDSCSVSERNLYVIIRQNL